MAVNPYFNKRTVSSEQTLVQDLVDEAIQIHGIDMVYIPRTLVNEDQLFGEDRLPKFENGKSIEMYIENFEGFEGEGEVMTQFGLEIKDNLDLTVSRRRFLETFASENYPYPREGDLIYFPMTGHLFEIRFVSDPDPFYQLGKIYVFKMQVSLFEYSGEDFDTGTAADLVEADQAYTIELTMTGSGNYTHGENLTTVIDGVTTTVGEVVLWQPQANKLTIKDNTRTLQVGDVLTGVSSTTARPIGSIVDVMTFENLSSAQNKDFEDKDSNYLDFSEVNPFGEP